MKKLIFLISISLLIPSNSFAGGAAARKQQGQQRVMQQRMIQQKQMQQMMLQRKAVEQNAVQQTQQQVIQQTVAQQNAQVKAVAGLEDVMKALTHSGKNWTLIIDQSAKEIIVREFINQYQQQGVVIKHPPSHYVTMIDGMAQGNPAMLNNPFPSILQVVAIMEYDFDNGKNKDEMARRILDENAYRQNLKRLKEQSGY